MIHSTSEQSAAKVCSRKDQCVHPRGPQLPLSEFYRLKSSKDGLKHLCKKCDSAQTRKYHRENAEKMRQYHKEYNTAHPGANTARCRVWRNNNRERWAEYNRSYFRKRQDSDPAFADHIRRTRAISARVRYNTNPASREKMVMTRRRYEARCNSVPINDLTPGQWEWLVQQSDHCCVYCGKYAASLAMEHVVPVSKGGSTTLSNIVPACKSCNSRKKDRTPAEAGMTFAIQINPLEHMTQTPLFEDGK